jgi:hypothetical protein
MWFEWFQQLLILKNKRLKFNRKSSTVHTREAKKQEEEKNGEFFFLA